MALLMSKNIYKYFKTLFIYLLISIKKSFSIDFICKKIFCKIFNNFLKKIINIVNNLKAKNLAIYLSILFLITFYIYYNRNFLINHFLLQIFSSQIFNKSNHFFFPYINYNFMANFSDNLD